jgi:hypothetical protein
MTDRNAQHIQAPASLFLAYEIVHTNWRFRAAAEESQMNEAQDLNLRPRNAATLAALISAAQAEEAIRIPDEVHLP